MAHLFQILNDSAFATSIRESMVIFPLVESVHVIAIMLLAGTVAIFDLRLLGLVLTNYSVSQVAGRVLPLTWTGFAVMAASGTLLFIAEAAKCYSNPAFRLKMLLLVITGLNPLLFHCTIYRSVEYWNDVDVTPWQARAAAVVSLTLYSAMIIAGRAIAYF